MSAINLLKKIEEIYEELDRLDKHYRNLYFAALDIEDSRDALTTSEVAHTTCRKLKLLKSMTSRLSEDFEDSNIPEIVLKQASDGLDGQKDIRRDSTEDVSEELCFRTDAGTAADEFSDMQLKLPQDDDTDTDTLPPDVVNEADAYTGTEIYVQDEIEVEMETQLDFETQAEAEIQFESETQAEAETQFETETQAEAETQFESETQAEAVIQAEAETQLEFVAEAESGAQADLVFGAEARGAVADEETVEAILQSVREQDISQDLIPLTENELNHLLESFEDGSITDIIPDFQAGDAELDVKKNELSDLADITAFDISETESAQDVGENEAQSGFFTDILETPEQETMQNVPSFDTSESAVEGFDLNEMFGSYSDSDTDELPETAGNAAYDFGALTETDETAAFDFGTASGTAESVGFDFGAVSETTENTSFDFGTDTQSAENLTFDFGTIAEPEDNYSFDFDSFSNITADASQGLGALPEASADVAPEADPLFGIQIDTVPEVVSPAEALDAFFADSSALPETTSEAASDINTLFDALSDIGLDINTLPDITADGSADINSFFEMSESDSLDIGKEPEALTVSEQIADAPVPETPVGKSIGDSYKSFSGNNIEGILKAASSNNMSEIIRSATANNMDEIIKAATAGVKIENPDAGDANKKDIANIPEPSFYNEKTPERIILLEKEYTVKDWSEILIKVCFIMHLHNPPTVAKFDKNILLNNHATPNFSYNENDIVSGKKRLPNGLWIETDRSPAEIVQLCRMILEICGYNSADLVIAVNG